MTNSIYRPVAAIVAALLLACGAASAFAGTPDSGGKGTVAAPAAPPAAAPVPAPVADAVVPHPAIEIPAALADQVKAAGEALVADARAREELERAALTLQRTAERDQLAAENLRLRACHLLGLDPDDTVWSEERDATTGAVRTVLRTKPPAAPKTPAATATAGGSR